MAEITSRRRGELVRGVFEVLMDKPDGLPAAQALKAVEQLVPPTAFERETYERNPTVRRYEKTIRFSTITSVKAGWLVKSGGTWSLTEEGRRAYLLGELTPQPSRRRPPRDGRAAAGAPLRSPYGLATLRTSGGNLPILL